jgi:hypothetical protein
MAECPQWVGKNAFANAHALELFATDCSFIMTLLCQFLSFSCEVPKLSLQARHFIRLKT